ncbi:MAG: 3'-5' exonuclease, partial [Saprospiraceae bacterium]
MIENIDAGTVLFLDIETVSAAPTYDELGETMRELWTYKAPQAVRRPRAEMEEEDFRQAYDDRAGIFAEFGKIVCISVGVVFRSRDDQRLRLRLKSFASDDERELLEGFSAMLQQYYKDPAKCYLCGHN